MRAGGDGGSGGRWLAGGRGEVGEVGEVGECGIVGESGEDGERVGEKLGGRRRSLGWMKADEEVTGWSGGGAVGYWRPLDDVSGMVVGGGWRAARGRQETGIDARGEGGDMPSSTNAGA